MAAITARKTEVRREISQLEAALIVDAPPLGQALKWLWQVTFQFLPRGIVDEFNILPAEILRFLDQTEGPRFNLPPNYAQQAAEILPTAQSLSDEMELWGDDKHDDLSIYHNRGEVFSIETRIDVRKFDSVLLSGLLALADSWSSTLVETRYRKVCRTGLEDFRAFLAGHPHCLAMKEPDVWFPAFADEVKRAEGEPWSWTAHNYDTVEVTGRFLVSNDCIRAKSIKGASSNPLGIPCLTRKPRRERYSVRKGPKNSHSN